MAWAKLYSEIKGTDNVNFDTGTITANTFIQIMFYQVGHSGNSELYFNGDNASTNYTRRGSANGASDFTLTSEAHAENFLTAGTADPASLGIAYIVNISSEEKLIISHTCNQNTAGAANAPTRSEITGKWANTAAQITQIEVDDSGTGFDTGSAIAVIGTD